MVHCLTFRYSNEMKRTCFPHITMAQEMLQSPQNHVKWGNSNEQTAIGKHLGQNTFDELIITACVQSGLIVNTDAPWLGAIQISCYIIKCPFSKIQTDF